MKKSIRELLKTKCEVKTLDVEHDGALYTVAGSNDATLVTSLLLDDDQVKQKASHWRTFLNSKSTIDGQFVRMVQLVLKTLQPQDGEQPYTEMEVVRLGLEHGTLFLKLVQAANNVMNLNDSNSESLAEGAVGNLNDTE